MFPRRSPSGLKVVLKMRHCTWQIDEQTGVVAVGTGNISPSQGLVFSHVAPPCCLRLVVFACSSGRTRINDYGLQPARAADVKMPSFETRPPPLPLGTVPLLNRCPESYCTLLNFSVRHQDMTTAGQPSIFNSLSHFLI